MLYVTGYNILKVALAVFFGRKRNFNEAFRAIFSDGLFQRKQYLHGPERTVSEYEIFNNNPSAFLFNPDPSAGCGCGIRPKLHLGSM